MTDKHEIDRDMAGLFLAEEQVFESEAFVDDITRSIRRRSLVRRAVLSGAALIGGILAGAQLTNLIQMLGVSTPKLQSYGELQANLTATTSLDPLWVAVTLIVATISAMLVIIERA